MNYRDIIKLYNLESLNYDERYEFYKQNSSFELWKFFHKREYQGQSYFRDCEAMEIWFRVMKLKQPLDEAIKEMAAEIINHYKGEDIPCEVSYIAEMCDM